MAVTDDHPLAVAGSRPKGVNVIEDTCSACGEQNPAGSQFCLFCGGFLGWEERPVDARRTTSATLTPTESATTLKDSGPTRPTSSGGPVTEEPAVLPTVALPVVGVAEVPETAGGDCPSCHTTNDDARHFCRKCGLTLHPPVGAPTPVLRRPSWWRRLWLRIGRPDERAARRAYRHSLPGLYRWRRRLLVLLAVVVVGGALTLIGRNPAQLAVAAWHDLRGDVVQVDGVTASTLLPKGVTEGAPAAVDGDNATAWTSRWAAPATPPACGAGSAAAGLRLTFPKTQVKQIRLIGGVTDPSRRPLELLPKTLHLTASDGSCVTVELKRSATAQTVRLDTDDPVTSLTITVASTYAPTDPGRRTRAQVSLTEVSLWARPD